MHGVDAQIARLAFGIGPPPFSDGHGGGPRLDVVETAFAIARLLAQVIQVRHPRSRPAVGTPACRTADTRARECAAWPARSSSHGPHRQQPAVRCPPGYSVAESDGAVNERAGPRRCRYSGRSAASPAPGSGRASSPGSAAAIPVRVGFAWSTAAGTEPARSSGKPALGFRLRTGSLGWLLEKPRSDPGSVFLLRARWLSILSMPSAPGSSCVGIPPPLQAHLVLEKTHNVANRRDGCTLGALFAAKKEIRAKICSPWGLPGHGHP